MSVFIQDSNLLVARWGDESVGAHFLSIDCVLYSGRINLTIISNKAICVDITVQDIKRRDTIGSCDKEIKFYIKVYVNKKHRFGHYGSGQTRVI